MYTDIHSTCIFFHSYFCHIDTILFIMGTHNIHTIYMRDMHGNVQNMCVTISIYVDRSIIVTQPLQIYLYYMFKNCISSSAFRGNAASHLGKHCATPASKPQNYPQELLSSSCQWSGCVGDDQCYLMYVLCGSSPLPHQCLKPAMLVHTWGIVAEDMSGNVQNKSCYSPHVSIQVTLLPSLYSHFALIGGTLKKPHLVRCMAGGSVGMYFYSHSTPIQIETYYMCVHIIYKCQNQHVSIQVNCCYLSLQWSKDSLSCLCVYNIGRLLVLEEKTCGRYIQLQLASVSPQQGPSVVKGAQNRS